MNQELIKKIAGVIKNLNLGCFDNYESDKVIEMINDLSDLFEREERERTKNSFMSSNFNPSQFKKECGVE